MSKALESLGAKELIDEAESYQRIEARDDEGDTIELRAVLYEDDSDGLDIIARRAALRRQHQVMKDLDGCSATPTALGWHEVQESPVDRPPEPILRCERLRGQPLDQWMEEHAPQGLEAQQALRWTDEVAALVVSAHEAGWLWRDFDPRRFVVDDSGDRLRAWAVDGAIRMSPGEEGAMVDLNEAYVAPEVRDDKEGKRRSPAADLYGLGALLSFLLSGQEPRHRVESPVSYPAYERVQEHGLPGLELLLGATLQPLSTQRLDQVSAFRAHLKVDLLPQDDTPGFADKRLPAPWTGLEMEDPASNRGLRSNLSAGPLVSLPSGEGGGAQETATAPDDEVKSAVHWPTVLIMGAVMGAALLWLLLR